MKRPNTRVIAALLAVLALLVLLASFDRTPRISPFSPVNLDGPMVADTDGDVFAVADTDSRRVLFLDSNRELAGILYLDRLNTPVSALTDLCVSNGKVYVAGVRYKGDSDIVESERIVCYDRSGNQLSIPFETSEGKSARPSIKAMCESDDGVYVCRSTYELHEDSDDGKVTLFHLDEGGEAKDVRETSDTADIFDIGVDPGDGSYVTLSQRGIIDDEYDLSVPNAQWPHVFLEVDLGTDEEVLAYDDSTDAICNVGGDMSCRAIYEEPGLSGINVNRGRIIACNRAQGHVIVCDMDGGNAMTFGSVTPNARLRVLLVLTWASRFYLVGLAIVLLAKKARSVTRLGQVEGMGTMFASVMVVTAVGLAVAYTSYGTYSASQATRANEINAYADYVGYIAPKLAKSLEKVTGRDVIRHHDTAEEALDGLFDAYAIVGDLTYAATDNGIGTYMRIYGRDDRGVFSILDSSEEDVMGCSTRSEEKDKEVLEVFKDPDADSKIRAGHSLHDSTQYRLVGIPKADGTGVGWVIEIGSHMRSFSSSVRTSLAQRILAVLVMMLVVYLSYAEIRYCGRCLFSYRSLQQRHADDAIAVLTRPFSFCVTALSSVDAVMTTLIARSLLERMGMEGSALLLALPAVMQGVGLALGQALYGFLGSRVSLRKIMTRGSLAVMACASVAATVVGMQEYAPYCAAKLLLSVPLGLLYTLSYSLPRRARTDEVRDLAAGGIKRTDTSAAALGTVLGGYAALALGHAWVYVLVALASLPVLLMSANLLPADAEPLERPEDGVRSNRQAVAKLLGSRLTVCIVLFVMVPTILSAGYNSFLFPLYSSDLGIGSASVSNLFVLGQLVVFAWIPLLERLEARWGKWRTSVAAIASLGVVFLLLALNRAPVWAIVTIMLVGMLCKTADGWKALWMRSASENGVPAGLTAGVMFSVRSVLLIIQPLALSLLLSNGQVVNSWPLVALCGVCALCMWLLTVRTPLTKG